MPPLQDTPKKYLKITEKVCKKIKKRFIRNSTTFISPSGGRSYPIVEYQPPKFGCFWQFLSWFLSYKFKTMFQIQISDLEPKFWDPDQRQNQLKT